jgi:hypothetical protein
VAEGPGEDERVEESKRQQRSDWFGQSLGAEWVEIEPGIYRQRSPAAPGGAETPLDQELLEALPNAERDGEAEPEAPPTQRAPQRHWFRR